jgi:hypothetical protein
MQAENSAFLRAGNLVARLVVQHLRQEFLPGG